MNLIGRAHGQYVHGRRVTVLRDYLAEMIPQRARLLDVGCGDGLLTRLIGERRQDLEVSGIDVLVRPETRISISAFDGTHIPFDNKSFDVVMFVDVLHHTDDPLKLLSEAKRVARQAIVIKDHRLNGLLAGPTLRFMDWVGNAPHGVNLPYNYWPHDKWLNAFERLQLRVGAWRQDLELYPAVANWFFGRSLHFVARLDLDTGTAGVPARSFDS
jgi:SAM-dependent methyltransferase